jgi:hypothetical protein
VESEITAQSSVEGARCLNTFLGTLLQFIKQLGLEYCDHLDEQGTPNKFISTSVVSKAMWDRLQEKGTTSETPETLICLQGSWEEPWNQVLRHHGNKLGTSPLHLEIRACHKEKKRRSGEPPTSTKVSDFKTVLVPRQHILKKLTLRAAGLLGRWMTLSALSTTSILR